MKKILLIVAAAIASVSAFAQPKFAHVNMQELVMLMPEADQARKTMQAASTEAEETFKSMADEFDAKYQKYQANAANWSAAIREAKEKELNEIQQRIAEIREVLAQELNQKQNELMAPISEKAKQVVSDLAKAGGYIYVFDVSTFYYLDEKQSVDLTPQARKTLGIPEGRTLESLMLEQQAEAQAAAAKAAE